MSAMNYQVIYDTFPYKIVDILGSLHTEALYEDIIVNICVLNYSKAIYSELNVLQNMFL